MDGHFQISITSRPNEDGTYTSIWEGPNGQRIEATSQYQSEAHRLVADQVRDGVLKREIKLSH